MNRSLSLWVIVGVLLFISAILMFACKEGSIWSNLGVNFAVFAISIPIIYLAVDKIIKAERANRWKKVKVTLIEGINTQAVGMLNIVNVLYSQYSVADLFRDRKLVIDEAKHICSDIIPNLEWSTSMDKLEWLVSSLEEMVQSLVSSIKGYGNILDEEPELFEKAINLEHEMSKLSAVSSTRFFDRDGKNYIRQEQSPIINESIQKLLKGLINFAD